MSTTIILVRHGETKWNLNNIFRGAYDIPLNDNGRDQAHLTAKTLEDYPIHAAYTSPLSRAVETARIVLSPHKIKATPHEGLLDMDYGEWTGIEDAEVAQKWPKEHTDWNSRPHTVRPPGGSTLQEVFDRAFAAMEGLANQHDGGTIALFSHRIINKLLIIGALGLGLERFPFIVQGNCCFNELELTKRGFIIKSLNNTSHITSAGTAVLQTDF